MENDGNSQEKDRRILLIDSIWKRIETLVVTCNQNVALISFDCRASGEAKRKMKMKWWGFEVLWLQWWSIFIVSDTFLHSCCCIFAFFLLRLSICSNRILKCVITFFAHWTLSGSQSLMLFHFLYITSLFLCWRFVHFYHWLLHVIWHFSCSTIHVRRIN